MVEEGFPHPLPTNIRCLKTFICCGWVGTYIHHHAATTITWINPDLGSQLESSSLLGLGYTRFHCAVVKALTQHGMDPTSPPNIYQVLDNVQMLWMGTAILEPSSCDYHYMCSPRCGKSNKILHHSWATIYKGYHCAVVEALTQDGRNPTSPPNTWKVFENLHMLWMGTWIYHNAVTTTCVNPDLGS
jgi:hypothetical protein